jgi:GTP cyclohydrolase IA
MTTSRNGGPALVAADAPETHLGRRPVDHARAQRAARELLLALGADVDSDGLLETPRRVADAYAELLTPRPFRATTFPNDDGYDELIIARSIPFHSLCMHHLLPFHGFAHVGYLPADRILGLSKLGRVVEYFSRDLQIQERLTTQVADWLEEELQPKGVAVCWRPSTCACRSAGCRSSARRPSPPRCAAFCAKMPGRAKSSSH